MKPTILVILAALVMLQCRREETASARADRIIERASAFLLAAQGDDGGWHSTTHGLLSSGQALTPYLLWSVMEAERASRTAKTENRSSSAWGAALSKGLKFIRKSVNEHGAVGFADPDYVEYPNYSTAYAIRVLRNYGTVEDSALIRRMVRYLAKEQFDERRGIQPSHAAYGSWGFGELNLRMGTTGHVDLSHTRRVLQALQESGALGADAARKAEVFLALVQKNPTHPLSPPYAYDGGFYFSPVILDANKAGEHSTNVFRSYATATCDGILALLATGTSTNDDRVRSAEIWLEENPALDYPPGIPEDHPEGWRKVLFFYHLAVRSEAYVALGKGGVWKQEMLKLLEERQSSDGSFANPFGGPNKEDDPMLATAFAIEIAGRCR